MSLNRALSKLAPDAHMEHVLRDVLVLFGHHEKEWLSEGEVQAKTGRTLTDVRSVLPALVEAFVLDFDAATGRYRYCGDAALSFEIGAFMRRVDYHQSHVRTNIARFRERQGY